jgi:hypothetical protein
VWVLPRYDERKEHPWLSPASRISRWPTGIAEWDGTAAEKRVRRWGGRGGRAEREVRDGHVWYDADKKENFTGYKLLVADVIGGELKAVPRGVMAAGNVMQGSRGGVDLPEKDIARVKSHLAKYLQERWARTRPGRK